MARKKYDSDSKATTEETAKIVKSKSLIPVKKKPGKRGRPKGSKNKVKKKDVANPDAIEMKAPLGCKSEKELREEAERFIQKHNIGADGDFKEDLDVVLEDMSEENKLRKEIMEKLAVDLVGAERRFIEMYINGMTSVDAYKRSGLLVMDMKASDWNGGVRKYSAVRRARFYMNRPSVKMYLNVITRVAADRCSMTLEAADKKLVDMINADVVDVINLAGKKTVIGKDGIEFVRIDLKDLEKLSVGQRAAISGLKYKNDGSFEIKMIDKLKALEMFYKRKGGYVKGSGGGGFGDGEGGDGVGGSGTGGVNVHGENVQIVTYTGNNGRGVVMGQDEVSEADIVGVPLSRGDGGGKSSGSDGGEGAGDGGDGVRIGADFLLPGGDGSGHCDDDDD